MKRTCLVGDDMVKDKWQCSNLIFEGDHSSDFPWPQKSYTCNFCKRQFNSAQALGGHMNVHRRDRARLRQLPSWTLERPNPTSSSSNTNPNFSSSTSLSSPTVKLLPCPCTHKSLLSPSFTSFSSPSYQEKKSIIECPHCDVFCPQKEDLSSKKSMNTVDEVDGLKKGFTRSYEPEVLKRGEIINLELEIGCKDPKEFLDLELRLGCFN